eukprot:350724-Chlamydomonas_euryale.AAC.8
MSCRGKPSPKKTVRSHRAGLPTLGSAASSMRTRGGRPCSRMQAHARMRACTARSMLVQQHRSASASDTAKGAAFPPTSPTDALAERSPLTASGEPGHAVARPLEPPAAPAAQPHVAPMSAAEIFGGR